VYLTTSPARLSRCDRAAVAEQRVPLIIRARWIKESVGRVSSVLAELVDVFPSISDLAGLQLPHGEVLDGVSLRPALTGDAVGLKSYALSQYPRCPANVDNASLWYKDNVCEWVDRSKIFSMGFSIRTQRWRLTQWIRWDGRKLKGNWSAVIGTELYDHLGDTGASFDDFEHINEANHYPDVVNALSKQLRAAFDTTYTVRDQ
jgi:iduronate 2-sulfatase